jgi:SAM-dependent methyltransferase
MISPAKNIRLLDFGCGDGRFLNMLNCTNIGGGILIGFEPYMDLTPDNPADILKNWAEVECRGHFNYITCFEVLEHLGATSLPEALQRMRSVLTDEGLVIVSVPIEKGFPSVVKNISRKFSRDQKFSREKGRKVYSIKNILSAFFGKPLPLFRQGERLSHLGFYYTELESVLTQHFDIVERSFSPFPYFGSNLNSQVFYKLKKKALQK